MSPTTILSRLALAAAVAAVLGMAPGAHAQTYQFKTFAKGLTPTSTTPGEEVPDEGSSWATASLSSSALAFGSHAIGDSSTVRSVSVLNNDVEGRPLRIDSISTDHAEFVASHDCPVAPATLAAGTSCAISVTYLATVEANLNQNLTVVTARNTVQASLAGQAGGSELDVLQEINGDFGEMLPEQSMTRLLSLVNNGPAPLLIEKAEIVGSDVFQFFYDGCTGVSIAGNRASSCSVHVTAAAVSTGEQSATLQITVGGSVVLSRNLTATGVAPFFAGAMTPAEVDSGDTGHSFTIVGSRLGDASFTFDGTAVPVEAIAVNEDGTEATISVENVRFGMNQVRVTRAGQTVSPTPAAVKATVELSADSGSAEGGEEIVITGHGFDANTIVRFGDTQVTVLEVTSESITVASPAGPAGETVPVRIQRTSGSFSPTRDLEILSAYSFDEETSSEGQLSTLYLNAVAFQQGGHMAANPATDTYLWNNGSTQLFVPGQTNPVLVQAGALQGANALATSPFAPVGYLFSGSSIKWVNLDGGAFDMQQTAVIKRSSFPLIGSTSDAAQMGALSQDGGTYVVYMGRSSNANGNSLFSVPIDPLTGAPDVLNYGISPYHTGAPAGGYGNLPNRMAMGPDGSVWVLYNGASSRAPMIRRYNSVAMDGPVDFVLPLTGESAYPNSATGASVPTGFTVDGQGFVYVAMQRAVYRFDPRTQTGSIYVGNPTEGGVLDGVGAEARLNMVQGITFSQGRLLVMDAESGLYSHLREID